MLTETAVREKLHANALNFSGGPGALPESVLAETRDAIVELPETGLSLLGTSHRSDWFRETLAEAEANLRALIGLSDDFAVTFLQGGSSLQFAMIPMNFGSTAGAPPEYVNSGYWSTHASAEAAKVTPIQVAWDGRAGGYRRLPALGALPVSPEAAYLHYVSNETVEGLQFAPCEAPLDVPLVADMSSDFLSQPFQPDVYAMIYAHAQKNLGPAGVTVAIIRRDLLARIPSGLPAILDFRTHVSHGSNYNTPPVFAIYVINLVTRWLRYEIGGLGAMAAINARKSNRLYETLDQLDDLIAIHADRPWRSAMNVAFNFRDPRLNQRFIAAARAEDIAGIEGHRSIGGLRISLYNAVSEAAVETLCSTLIEFAERYA